MEEGQRVYRAFTHPGGLTPSKGVPVVCYCGHVTRFGNELVVQQGLDGAATYRPLTGWYETEAEAKAALSDEILHYAIRLLEQFRELQKAVAS